MDSGLNQLHFVLLPLMSPGHLIPMTDMAKLLAQHGVIATIVTTPLNAIKFSSMIQRAVESGLKIQFLTLNFPYLEAGLPEGCENMAKLPERSLIKNFFAATNMLQQPFENLLQTLQPPVSCIVSGKNLGWTVETCRKFKIPRIFFDGIGCFAFSCTSRLETSKVHEGVPNSDSFMVPGLPHKVELTKAKLPENLNPGSADLTEARNKMRAAEAIADGIVVNTFEELEAEYVKEYKRVKGNNVWCIGPVSGCHKYELDKVERGEMASIDVNKCLKWLDSWEPGSVIYACLGSICGLKPWQLKELGLGLEASNRPFIWVIRGGEKSEGLEKWISEEGFEERTMGRGLVIRGWAPQLLILSHPAIGGFLTHCGWNSTLEGAGAGVPLVTCPLFAEQFFNEKLVVEVMAIGVSVGVEAAVTWGLEEEAGLVMKSEDVKKAIDKVMDKGDEAEARRKKAREIGEMAKRAIEEGGSSYLNMELLIQYVKQQY
ncbi:UDP-glycosyltransferase 73C3 [Morus notabilis]|uniref:Glycosyltransferase n=1 Tax=Morus notabilis TaxID=981085 RepID=W9RIX0_9ROSA|nr:UDP-glycosyltransferase 73C6 [Morus notabilis]EXB75921.1 UDP-glycosyltransferase 73C3 [Morus notabilis]